MNRQFGDQASHRVGAKIDVGQSRVAAYGQRWTVCWRKTKAGLGQPVGDEGFEMLTTADALISF